MPYGRMQSRSDRAKAAAAVVLVHAALGALLLSGLKVELVTAAVDRLKTFSVALPPPPPITPEPPPAPTETESAPREEAAPENSRSEPTPVVAPTPPVSLPIPLPVNAAKRPSPDGTDRSAGARACTI
jgi:periplasmic protein TonB